jgi:hypothetical protein
VEGPSEFNRLRKYVIAKAPLGVEMRTITARLRTDSQVVVSTTLEK